MFTRACLDVSPFNSVDKFTYVYLCLFVLNYV